MILTLHQSLIDLIKQMLWFFYCLQNLGSDSLSDKYLIGTRGMDIGEYQAY